MTEIEEKNSILNQIHYILGDDKYKIYRADLEKQSLPILKSRLQGLLIRIRQQVQNVLGLQRSKRYAEYIENADLQTLAKILNPKTREETLIQFEEDMVDKQERDLAETIIQENVEPMQSKDVENRRRRF